MHKQPKKTRAGALARSVKNQAVKHFLVFSFVLAAASVSGESAVSPRERGIQIPENPEHAWISPLAAESLLLAVEDTGGQQLVAVGERGHVLYREKGADQWHQADVPTQALLTGVSFSDARHGWAVGHDAIILATADGGRTWRKVHEAADEERPLLDIHFQDRHTGIAIGAYGYLLRTGDGGASWQPGVVDPEHDFHLNAIAAVPGDLARGAEGAASRLYIAAESGVVYRSDDGGSHWRILNPPYDGSFFGVYPLAGDRVLAFGLRGHLFVSEDAGGHWRAVATGTEATLTSAIGLDGGQILLTGHAGALLLLDADLQTVHRARLPERRDFSDVIRLGPDRVLLVGEGGVRAVDLCSRFGPDALPGCGGSASRNE
uniref:Photosynthesis system II assembly factor Ycf48/Hcf136-like domain-containing protein n=1 Tax=Candidatus Kentrum sp. DK TaxID=2126562 RepID=A0A450S9S1_9GAMM|nr:MAG: Uncharacterized protein BECKDK2373B_GA0170837_102122 [Candidatus Kentron sp. DK]